MSETYVKYGTHRERRTGRGNKGNAAYQELTRLEREWKRKHT